MIPLFLTLSVASAQDSEKPLPYGADVSIAVGPGALLGEWPDPGVHGFVLARYDAFTQPSHIPGPRLGASLWGGWTPWPLQNATEEEDTFPFDFTQFGILAILRHDPAAPISGNAGFGFGRIDLSDYWGGPHTLPTVTFEVGARAILEGNTFADLLVRAHWATARGPDDELDEWWGAQLLFAVGQHLH